MKGITMMLGWHHSNSIELFLVASDVLDLVAVTEPCMTSEDTFYPIAAKKRDLSSSPTLLDAIQQMRLHDGPYLIPAVFHYMDIVSKF